MIGRRQYSCKEQTEALAELEAHREEVKYGIRLAQRIGRSAESVLRKRSKRVWL